MGYSAVYIFGDSLVDAGNALELAEWYGDLTSSELPEGAPTESKGYFEGRFTDGYTFADLLSNKLIGEVTQPIFPFHYEDPWFGFPIDPFEPEPKDNNLNFAYGGAQIIQGDEVVPDLNSQVAAFQDATDSRADPNALYFVTMGGNDVRSLAPATRAPVDQLLAYQHLQKCAAEMIDEITQLISLGARNIMISGIPDVGLIPNYDLDAPGTAGHGQLEGEELERSGAATDYSVYLDNLIRTQVVPAIQQQLIARGLTAEQAAQMVTYIPVMGNDYVGPSGNVTVPALEAVLPILEDLHGLADGSLTANLLEYRSLVFFDQIHPTAQVHALVGAFMHSQLTGAPWIEQLPLAGAELNYVARGSIAVAGEVDLVTVTLVAGTTYTLEMLGMSSLGVAGSLGDGSLRILGPNGAVVTQFAAGSGNDSGAGFDASFTFTAAATGRYTIELSAAGLLTGSYQLQGGVVDGTAMLRGDTYVVTSAATGVIEGRGGVGTDTVSTSVSYALSAGSEIEVLAAANLKSKDGISLTGNEFAQTIRGNAGANVIEGRGGADTLTGYAGKDVFVLGNHALLEPGAANIDRITDFERGDIVDLTQVISVGGGVNVASGGYVRVTSNGLIQVDPDGKGDGWVTLATIGSSSGTVSIRYLADGAVKTVNFSRVAETYASASVQAAPDDGLQLFGAAEWSFDRFGGFDRPDSGSARISAGWPGADEWQWAGSGHGIEGLFRDGAGLGADGFLVG